jgi:hypothetical protein
VFPIRNTLAKGDGKRNEIAAVRLVSDMVKAYIVPVTKNVMSRGGRSPNSFVETKTLLVLLEYLTWRKE